MLHKVTIDSCCLRIQVQINGRNNFGQERDQLNDQH